ncbi:MAG: Co2+/Mg2+ efflux protein ApaG [Bradymonadaceae bacterium]
MTYAVRITTESQYSPERSTPLKGLWFFVYRIRIENQSQVPLQLMTRHWLITNAEGEVSEVRGPGVVGQQPRLEPGDAFEYVSACPLNTPFGTMRGSYQMVTDEGEDVDVPVPLFQLIQPHGLN